MQAVDLIFSKMPSGKYFEGKNIKILILSIAREFDRVLLHQRLLMEDFPTSKSNRLADWCDVLGVEDLSMGNLWKQQEMPPHRFDQEKYAMVFQAKDYPTEEERAKLRSFIPAHFKVMYE